MKNVIVSVVLKCTMLCMMLVMAVSSFAQDEGSVYDIKVSKKGFHLYSGYFPYIVFGIVIVFLGYMGYKYWKDNMEDEHLPHHQ